MVGRKMVAVAVCLASALAVASALAFVFAAPQAARATPPESAGIPQAGQPAGAAQAAGIEAAEGGDAGALGALGALQRAADDAAAYAKEQGFKSAAFKDVVEFELEGVQCYPVAPDSYFLLYDGNGYTCKAGEVAAAAQGDTPLAYDTFAAACASVDASETKPAAFITCGLAAQNDKGHGYYVRRPDAENGASAAGAYELASAESAVNVFQLGYAPGSSVNPAIAAFQESGFHTLVFPPGDYLLDDSVWQRVDDRAFYGLDARLYTDDAFCNTHGNATMDTLWCVRGDIAWGERQDGGSLKDTYYTTVRQEYNGLAFEKPTAISDPGYRYFASVRNAADVSFSHCSFVADGYDVMCIDLYGNYDGISFDDVTCKGNGDLQIRDLCDNVGNLEGETWVQKGTEGGGRNVSVRNCTFTMNSIDEGLPIFAGNEEGLGYTDGHGAFHEYAILEHCLVEHVALEGNTWVMEEPPADEAAAAGKSRIVAFTCGYQDSPVRDIVVRGNTFDVFAQYCFAQFGYAEDVEFSGNDVTMRGSADGRWADVFERDHRHTRTGPTSGVDVSGNTFSLGGGRGLTRVVDPALGSGVLSFTGNDLFLEGRAERLLDSTATCAHNAFRLNGVKSLYSNVGDVHDNIYEIAQLDSLYQADGLSAAADARIVGERASVERMPDRSHLMTFNNGPAYNGHSIAFSGCYYDIVDAPYRWRRIAYDTSGIADGVTVRFSGCFVNGFDQAPFNTIDANDPEKVKLVIDGAADGDAFSLCGVEAVLEGGGFEDLAGRIAFASRSAGGVGHVGQLSGEVVGGFSLLGDARLDDAEASIGIDASLASDGDVLEIYRCTRGSYELVAYAEVVDGAFSFETAGIGAGAYAVVDKARGKADPAVFEVAADVDKHKDALRRALGKPGVYQASAPLSIAECTVGGSHGVTAAELHGTTISGGGPADWNNITFEGAPGAPDVHLYFDGCTFDAQPLKLGRAGTYVFDHCTFANSPQVSIAIVGAGVEVYVFNSEMRDNEPPLDEFNADSNSVRHWKYAALSFQSDDASLHVCRTSISGYQTNPTVLASAGHKGNALFFEHCTMSDCGGCGIYLASPVRGRVADNAFRNIGALRGERGYAVTESPRWGYPVGVGRGRGVGGNALYTNAACYNMRVSGNDIRNVMENAIEGSYWCVDANTIDMTGYRFQEGFDTVSTEAIWGGSVFVRGNEITHPHGHGILACASNETFPSAASGITVSGNRIEKNSYGLMDDKEGIRVIAGDDGNRRVLVTGNYVKGFLRPTRLIGSGQHEGIDVTFADNEEIPRSAELALARIESQSGDEDFADVSANVAMSYDDEPGASELGCISGRFEGAFTLALAPGAPEFGYAEATLSLDAGIAQEGDVLALYRREGDAWRAYGYYQAHEGGLTFELDSSEGLGRFALVNKSAGGGAAPRDIEGLDGASKAARLWAALGSAGSYTASGTLAVPHRYLDGEGSYASRLEFHGMEFAYSDAGNDGGFTFASAGPNDFYFEGCTFRGLSFTFLRPGTYAFENCTFSGYPKNAVSAQATGAHVFLYGCTFADNAPDKDYWNQCVSGDHYNNYSAVRLRGDSTSINARSCTFENLRTDTTVHVQKVGDRDFANVNVCFEGNAMTNCGGAGIVMDNAARGRIDGNRFAEIGGTRGLDGYKSTIHDTLGEYDADGNGAPGAGVGGNAVFGRGRNVQMRVRGNTCTNLMENAIEGTYFCISGNTIDTTGYRYDDPSGDSYNGGYKTVSTEGIAAAGTWYVTDNVALNVHGRGIGISHWNNHPVLIEGNTVKRRANGHPGDDTSEGIKIRTDADSWANVTVRGNVLSGFSNNYRVLHADDPNKARTCENVTIEDANHGKVMGPAMSNVRGVKLTTNRDEALPFANGADAWSGSDLSGLSDEADGDGTAFVRLVANGDIDANGAARGRASQRFDLPDRTCIVCLELRVRSSSPVVNAFVTSERMVADGGLEAYRPYPEGDGGSYSQYKVPLSGIGPDDFKTVYVCMKARGRTHLGLFASVAGQRIDIAGVRGWYAQDGPLAYSITYDLAGGTLSKANPSSYTALDGFKLANPKRTGYAFAGWTGSNGTAAQTTVSIQPGSTGERAYKANWKRIAYSLSCNLNGGKLAKANPSSYHVATAAFTLRNPTRKGYAFSGWTGTGLKAATMKVTIPKGSTGNRAYKATWKALPDYLGKIPVSIKVSGAKATIVKLLAKATGSVSVNTVTDNPAAKVRPVAAIGNNAFAKSGIASVVLGANVKTVGSGAFANAKSLKAAKLGKNVTAVGASAFSGDKKLKTLQVASAKLTKTSCRKMLAGSSVTTVKLVGLTKAQKAMALKNYRAWFPKKVAGKKLSVK